MTGVHYKSWQDPNLIMAADMSILSLKECMDYCDLIIKRCEADEAYRDLMSYTGNFYNDKRQALAYLEAVAKAKMTIGEPDSSTPQQRHDARMLIAQVYSWDKQWEAGQPLRDHIYRLDELPPNCCDAYMYITPDVIPTIQVPGDLFPGYDPFADNQ